MQFVSIYQTHSQETWLPKYVFRVNNCPDPYNSSEWTRASKRLNCLHSLNSEKIDNVYHCIASAFLNETVEFCGRSILVTAGYCPVYTYTYTKADAPDIYTCDKFINGCPTQMFYSHNVRKYPSCLNVNKEFGCFLEEYNCPNESTKPKITNSIKDVKRETRSVILNISTTSSPAHTTICLLEIIPTIILLLYGIMLEIHLIYRFVYTMNTKPNPEFRAFLQMIGNCIKKDTLQSMRNIVLAIVDITCFEQETETRILFELSEQLKLEYNMAFLEWIFDKCKAMDLVEKCQQFSAENKFQLKCFHTKVTPHIGNQHLQFKIMVSEKETVTSEVRDLRLWLAKTASVHPGEILNTALSIETELVVVTFLIKDRHANTLLKYAETNDGESLNEPNTNSKLKIATLIHHQKEIKLNYTRKDNARQLLNEPNSHCPRKKTRPIYARNVQFDPEDNETPILPLNQTKKKRKRPRRSIGVTKKRMNKPWNAKTL